MGPNAKHVAGPPTYHVPFITLVSSGGAEALKLLDPGTIATAAPL